MRRNLCILLINPNVDCKRAEFCLVLYEYYSCLCLYEALGTFSIAT